ncbi:MAG TPA: ATP-binding protein [Vicinamibacterales bacterium]|jgi:PAS domain S-box-containing protein
MAEQDRRAGGDGPAATLESVTAAWQETTDALRESERRYRELVEYSLGLICTHDLTGIILSINPAAATSLGYQPSEGIGRNLRDFLADDKRHLFDDYLRRISEHGQDAGLMRVVSRSGAERVWMYRNVLSHGASGPQVLGHAIDVTERIAAERTLRSSEQALRAAQAELEARVKERTLALERANDRLRLEVAEREHAQRWGERVLIEQRDTLAFLANSSDSLAPLVTFESLIDVVRRLPVPFLADWTMVHALNEDGSIRSVPGVHIDPTLEPLLTRVAAADSAALGLAQPAGERQLFESLNAAQLRTRLGESLPAADLGRLGAGAAAVLPLAIGGRVKAVLWLVSRAEERYAGANALIVEDVARRTRLALDRIQLYREAHEANRLKDEFLSTLSHELRTPLNAIFGWARILRARDLDGSVAHAVAVIERNAESQVRLIDEVLDVSRIVKGKMVLETAPLDVAAIVRATLDALRPPMQAKRIRIEERFTAVAPVSGDAHRLQQVFWNLISNAVKFTEPGGAIVIAIRQVGEAVEFEISDTGVGIRREILPFVFDRFRQADSSTTRTHGGLGLGLAIVKHIVELHGGTVRAASAGEGFGATFTIQLPGGPHRRIEQPAQSSAAANDAPGSGLRGRCILIVEDHEDARELIAASLGAAGARVIAASNAQDAIAAAERERPDLLLADIGLPGEDGYALLQRIRGIYPDLPAIALTAYARSTDRARALDAGFQRHVIKPVDPKDLLELIRSLV